MFDLKELSKWVTLTDSGIKFPETEPRKIRLEVLAENSVKLYVEDGKAKAAYIGTFEGYDVVQFNVMGEARLQADGPGCKIWSPEFRGQSFELPDAVSFTRTMTRRQRNPEMEKLAHQMQLNMERRLAQVQKDVTLRISEERRAINEERERERLERAAEAEAERLVVGEQPGEDEGEDESAAAKPPAKPGRNVPGGGGKAAGQKLAPKPASQG